MSRPQIETLLRLFERGQLREDLLYRINVVKIALPPLRERIQDVRLLADTFLAESAADHNKPFERFTEEAMKELMSYTWPGNVRQLKNVVQEAVVLNRGTEIEIAMLPTDIRESVEQGERKKMDVTAPFSPACISPLWQLEKEHISIAISACNGNVGNAADQLEISRATLYRKIKQYGLTLNEKDS